eukprot:SAG31_NODE_4670_length_3046_cov_1.967424_4_plen_266_part_00
MIHLEEYLPTVEQHAVAAGTVGGTTTEDRAGFDICELEPEAEEVPNFVADEDEGTGTEDEDESQDEDAQASDSTAINFDSMNPWESVGITFSKPGKKKKRRPFKTTFSGGSFMMEQLLQVDEQPRNAVASRGRLHQQEDAQSSTDDDDFVDEYDEPIWRKNRDRLEDNMEVVLPEIVSPFTVWDLFRPRNKKRNVFGELKGCLRIHDLSQPHKPPRPWPLEVSRLKKRSVTVRVYVIEADHLVAMDGDNTSDPCVVEPWSHLSVP